MEKVTIFGGSGLVGSRLQQMLESKYDVYVASTRKSLCQQKPNYKYWNYASGEMDQDLLETDHVVNLAGAGIADKKWTNNRKRILRESRTLSTKFLISQFRKNEVSLKSYVGASAMGYYGDCRDAIKSEDDSPCTHDFLSSICSEWEENHHSASEFAKNCSILRISTVLSNKGGALTPMARPVRFGMATYMGSGDQYMSWIHVDDLCRMIEFSMTNEKSNNVINAASPNPVTNKEFMKDLKNVLNPVSLLVPAPGSMLKLAMGEMSAIVLNSCRLLTEKVTSQGFACEFPTLKEALRDIYNQ